MVGEDIARAALEINAIKLSPNDPFTWASGYKMPIYNDNRMFLFDPTNRRMIANSFYEAVGDLNFDIVAGTSTAGIPHAAILSDKFSKPMIYVRDKPKGHGLRNQIEGIDADGDLEGYRVLLIEDLISTGSSSARAVQAIRDANGECNNCYSIFDYGLRKSVDAFTQLDPDCNVKSLLDYDTLLRVAKDIGYINDTQASMLQEWREDPFGWGEANGFSRVE